MAQTERIEGRFRSGSPLSLRRIVGQHFISDLDRKPVELRADDVTIWIDAGWCVVRNDGNARLNVTRYGITRETDTTISVHVPYDGPFKIKGRSFSFKARRANR